MVVRPPSALAAAIRAVMSVPLEAAADAAAADGADGAVVAPDEQAASASAAIAPIAATRDMDRSVPNSCLHCVREGLAVHGRVRSMAAALLPSAAEAVHGATGATGAIARDRREPVYRRGVINMSSSDNERSTGGSRPGVAPAEPAKSDEVFALADRARAASSLSAWPRSSGAWRCRESRPARASRLAPSARRSPSTPTG